MVSGGADAVDGETTVVVGFAVDGETTVVVGFAVGSAGTEVGGSAVSKGGRAVAGAGVEGLLALATPGSSAAASDEIEETARARPTNRTIKRTDDPANSWRRDR